MDMLHAPTHRSPLRSSAAPARWRPGDDAPKLLMVLALAMAALLLGLFGAVVRDHVQTAEAARQSAREGSVSPVAALSPEGDRVTDAQAGGPRIDSRGQAK